MGAFILYKNYNHSAIKENYETYFKKINLKKSIEINLGQYHLKLYRKLLINTNNYINIDKYYLFVCGSLFYNNASYKESLRLLLIDYINNSIRFSNLYGNYVLIFFNSQNKHIDLYTDPAHIKNLYINYKNKIISTHLLAIYYTNPNSYTLNELGILENLTTGNLIGPDTYFNEIEKIDGINYHKIDKYFPGIKTLHYKEDSFKLIINNYKDALLDANQRLDNYFFSIKSLTNEYGAHIGLTGGFDSRLLLMHAKKHLDKLITNSFWRPNSLEFEYAKKLASVAKLEFISFEKKPYNKQSKYQMLENAFYFFDGQIRTQNFWQEEFNQPEYIIKLAKKHFVGFHGAGGEQYRNYQRFRGHIHIKTYIKLFWILRQSGNLFINKKYKDLIIDNIENKIKRLTGIKNNKLDLKKVKIIENIVWNNANRVLRINAINQLMFYFAPFTEYQIAMSAYQYIPFLGRSVSFEIEMMKLLDDQSISSVNTIYDYNILKGEPFIKQLFPFLLNILPKSMLYSFYFNAKKIKNYNFNHEQFQKTVHPLIRDYENILNYDLINKNYILKNTFLSFDYFLKKIKPQ